VGNASIDLTDGSFIEAYVGLEDSYERIEYVDIIEEGLREYLGYFAEMYLKGEL
jgi:hypothetical protein